MTEAKDYGEPWTASYGCVDDRHNDTIARDATADEAARIVACVNACAGMADPAAEIAALKAENERLRTALRTAVNVACEAFNEWDSDNDHRVGKLLKSLSGVIPKYRADIDSIHAALSATERSKP